MTQVTTKGRPLCARRRLHDGRRRRASYWAADSAASPRPSGWLAASLLEAEIVTADGDVKIANACTNPDLFWALKGGGGGFRRRDPRHPAHAPAARIFRAACPRPSRRRPTTPIGGSLRKMVEFYAQSLFNPHWGEQLAFGPGYVLSISMVFQGLDQQRGRGDVESASSIGSPLRTQDFAIVSWPPRFVAVPARRFWDPASLKTASRSGPLR